MIGRRAFLALSLTAPLAHALGRRPYRGVLRLDVPLSLDGIDPAATDDVASALFSPAIADPLYAWDASGRPYPALASALPEASPGGARLSLRPGLVTARGRPLDAQDVVASIARSRARGGGPLLTAFGRAERVPGDPLAIRVPGASPEALAEALASPLTAIVPRGFTPEAPDGTGAFRAARTAGGFVLTRNDRSARGAAFLDRVELRHAPDLAAALRAFEAGEVDVGWLGAGLHRRRAGAVDLHADATGFIVLRTGPEGRTWGAPGVAERLVSGMDPSRFLHLGLGRKQPGSTAVSWGGAPADLLVEDGSPYLIEVARVVATVLSVEGHEIRAVPLPRAELRRRLSGGRYALALGFVRRSGPSARHALLSLLAAADPKLAEHPPNLTSTDLAAVGRTLPLAVLGELAVTGARAPDLHGLEQWDLGAVWKDG
jgi:peptide/nickel transport system substrate-binding protein